MGVDTQKIKMRCGDSSQIQQMTKSIWGVAGHQTLGAIINYPNHYDNHQSSAPHVCLSSILSSPNLGCDFNYVLLRRPSRDGAIWINGSMGSIYGSLVPLRSAVKKVPLIDNDDQSFDDQNPNGFQRKETPGKWPVLLCLLKCRRIHGLKMGESPKLVLSLRALRLGCLDLGRHEFWM